MVQVQKYLRKLFAGLVTSFAFRRAAEKDLARYRAAKTRYLSASGRIKRIA